MYDSIFVNYVKFYILYLYRYLHLNSAYAIINIVTFKKIVEK